MAPNSFDFCSKAYTDECPHKDHPIFQKIRNVNEGFKLKKGQKIDIITKEEMRQVDDICKSCDAFSPAND